MIPSQPSNESKAQAALRETLAQLQLISDAIPALISYVDREARYRMCNHAYTTWFGLEREQVIGKTLSDVLGDDVCRAIEPHMKAALAGQGRDFEVEVDYRFGGRRWIHAVYTPHRDAQGFVEGVVVMVTDITDRRRAEQVLHESEERYRSLFNSIDEGFCVIEVLFDEHRKPVDYFFHEVNPAFEKQTGMHGATGKRMLEFVSEIEPHWLENYGRVATTGEPIRFADEYKSLGSWFDVYAFRVGAPESRKVAILFNNITKRKKAEDAIRESEERFRNMSNHSPVMLWVTDAKGLCTHLNDRWIEFTCQTPETGLGMGWFAAVHPDDRQTTMDIFRAAHERRGTLRLEYRLRRCDGVHRWVLDTASPRFSESGEFLGYIGSVIDIQERKEAEIVLREAKEQAERASRAKDDFLAQLSHELRTPLTPVLMTAAALREDESLPPSVREQLAMIERNIALEARLIDDLLDLTRVTRGKLALRAEPCESHSLLGHVVEMVRDEAREKRLNISLELQAAHSHLNGDPARLQQVFWNLLRNAVKFTPPAGHIRVRSYDGAGDGADDTGRRLCIEVSDDGIGFAPETGERIFEPFEQGLAANDQRFPGLGLGLAIARAIVDLHGGHVRAQSAGPGLGATFTVELPVASRVAVAMGARQGTPPVPEGEPEPPMRLLVVEDDQATLQVLTRLLTRAGHQVTPATTITAAREAAARESFDAVVSDVGLPDGTGFELMEHLHAAHGLQGIALSGFGMEDDVQRSARAGFAAHLVKPVEINDLRRALRRLRSSPH
jgi:PAS domain S-box-containing protein